MLEPEDYDAVMTAAKVVSLNLGRQLFQQGRPIDAVYFPLTCMISLLVSSGDRAQMEMATIGHEGVAGAPELMQNQGAMGLGLVLIPGTAVRIDPDPFREVLKSRPEVKEMMYRHLYGLVQQILHGAICNRFHGMEKRCARWLLLTHDRAGLDTFPLTQEFLSRMLGVRRATVNAATRKLKKAGFIRYVRGKLTVTDRHGLESASCDCYRAITSAYVPLLPDVPSGLE